MNNFTPRAQQVLALSRKEADRFNHNYVGTEHLLLGLIRLGQGVAVNVLAKLGVDLETARQEVEKQVGSGPDTKMSGSIPYTPRVKKVLALAGKEAKQLSHSYVGTEHILLGLLREGDGVSARVLKSLKVDLERTRIEIFQELDPSGTASARYPERAGLADLRADERARVTKWLASSHGPGDAPSPDLRETPKQHHPAVASYLVPGEQLLWSGRRINKFHLERKHFPLLFLIPFFIFFLVCALTGIFAQDGTKKNQPPGQEQTLSAATSSPSTSNQPSVSANKPEPLLGRIFFAAFVVIMLGGFFSFMATIMGLNPGDIWRGDVFYGITPQRLIIVSGRSKKTVRSLYIGSLPELRMKEWPDGLGQITFGPEQAWPYRAPYRDGDTKLENISNPREVFQILIAARKSAS